MGSHSTAIRIGQMGFTSPGSGFRYEVVKMGHQAQCSCGWSGAPRVSKSSADVDAFNHKELSK